VRYAAPGSPYEVRRRDDGARIVAAHDLSLVLPTVLLLHMCRTFPVIITFPEELPDASGLSKRFSFLWILAGKRAELEAGMRADRLTRAWSYVTTDLVNDEEWALYRIKQKRMIDVDLVTREYFASANGPTN
jgi:hypothetical protein